jgi:hypothetical protein
MSLKRLTRHLFGIITVAFLILAPACKRGSEEPKEMRDVAEKVGELDKLSQQANTVGTQQSEKLKAAGVNDIRPDTQTMQLTEEQKAKLEERVKTEKDSSYRALLQEVIDKDKEITGLNEQMAKLKAILPKPDTAHSGDNHYSMALQYLRKKGISEEKAKNLINRVNIMEKLAPGFEVYHFYSSGVYGTWVNQGRSKVSPSDLVRQEREKVEGERDTAVAENEKLLEDVNDLMTEKNRLSGEIDGLRTERTTLITTMNELTAISEAQKAKLNSLHYVVGNRNTLKKDGVIVIPVFSKDRAGSNWADKVFDKSIDLRTNDALSFTATDAGLKQITKVNVVPGSLEKDKHYSLTIAPDKQSASVKLLVKDRFVNEKVVFAVVE